MERTRAIPIARGLVPALAALMLVGGCGGGHSVKAPRADPVGAVRVQLQLARAAMAREDVEAAMTVFSETYRDALGGTKAVVRQNLAAFVGIDLMAVTPALDQFTTSVDGRQVDHTWRAQFLFRTPGSDMEQVVDADGVTQWRQEGDTWRIVSSRNNGYLDVLPQPTPFMT
jgi:hypothetical protein